METKKTDLKAEANNDTIELDYKMVSFWNRFFANIIDFGLTLILTLIMIALSVLVANQIPSYTNMYSTREEILLTSELYKKDDSNNLVRISTYYENNEDLSYNEKSALIDGGMKAFFINPTYFDGNDGMDIYNKARTDATNSSGLVLFNEDYSRALVNSDYDKDYYTFYCDTVDNVAVSYLAKNAEYSKVLRNIFVSGTLIIVLSYLFSIIIFYFVFPLCFHRGYQTIGKKLRKMGIIDGNALNPSVGKFIGRFCFFFFVEVILSLVSFLIPLIVSLSFLVFSKRRQTLHDYVCNTYVVDVSDDDIFLNIEELKKSQELRNRASIENKNFNLK